MDGLEAQYGGYFIKNIRKLAFFWKKNAQKLASLPVGGISLAHI